MIDTGANVSLIYTNMYNKIQKESKISLPTLPVSNIVLNVLVSVYLCIFDVVLQVYFVYTSYDVF